jgi:hypothetical protein
MVAEGCGLRLKGIDNGVGGSRGPLDHPHSLPNAGTANMLDVTCAWIVPIPELPDLERCLPLLFTSGPATALIELWRDRSTGVVTLNMDLPTMGLDIDQWRELVADIDRLLTALDIEVQKD